MTYSMVENANRIPRDTTGYDPRPDIKVEGQTISFVISRKYIRQYVVTLLVIAAILLLALLLEHLYPQDEPFLRYILVLMLLFIAAYGVSMFNKLHSHRPLLTLQQDANTLTVYNFANQGNSCSLSEIALFLEIGYPRKLARDPNTDLLAVMNDGRLLFITSDIRLRMPVQWIHEAANMLGYVTGKKVLSMMFFGVRSSYEDTRAEMFSTFLENGSPIQETGSLTTAITPDARVNIDKLTAQAQVLYEPSADRRF